MKKVTKEGVWLSCMSIGPIICFISVYYPALSIVGIIFILIGIKGILVHVM